MKRLLGCFLIVFAFSQMVAPPAFAKRKGKIRKVWSSKKPSSKKSSSKRSRSKRSAKRGLAMRGGVQKKLRIRGQSRSLNMMLVVKNKKDRINFVKLRTDYKDEILMGTEF